MRIYIRRSLWLIAVALLCFAPVGPSTADAATPAPGGFVKPQMQSPVTAPLLKPPPAPANLTATAAVGQITLAWQDNSGGTASFVIERKTGATGTYAELKSVAPGTAKHTDTTAQAGNTYLYRVKAIAAIGDKTLLSPYSNEATASIPAPTAVTTGELRLNCKQLIVSTGELVLNCKQLIVTTGELVLNCRQLIVTTGELRLNCVSK